MCVKYVVTSPDPPTLPPPPPLHTVQASGGSKMTEGTLGASKKAQGKYLDFLDILLTAVVSAICDEKVKLVLYFYGWQLLSKNNFFRKV